ncbi:hypothetical protein DNTS_021970 [Danionella cerebrum]|uniref:Uncharacterized protein n=1 Tax=Danionella cerebrum TaxID=2873325 RepID=A0A553QLN3_9TELE|nr:hypothetical protein DNTS_021970 [Danionella translucida]
MGTESETEATMMAVLGETRSWNPKPWEFSRFNCDFHPKSEVILVQVNAGEAFTIQRDDGQFQCITAPATVSHHSIHVTDRQQLPVTDQCSATQIAFTLLFLIISFLSESI